MKKMLSLYIVCILVLPSFAFAEAMKKDCIECTIKPNTAQTEKINKVCNNISDVICKDVKIEERRGCSESDQYVFNKNASKVNLYNFAKGCFRSSVTSFTQFFTDFIPELLKGIWKATKSVSSLAVKSVSGNEPGLWSEMTGMYESTMSVAADVYEAVQENPVAYFDKIWSKIVDVVGPMVANYDCLNSQKKVEKICGTVTEWFIPPAILAKVLVRGIKEVKVLKASGTFSTTSSKKLSKTLEFAEKRPVLTLKQVQAMEEKFKNLGYTQDEFTLLYKTGALEKVKIGELKSTATADGIQQKKSLIGKPKVFEENVYEGGIDFVPTKLPKVNVKAKPKVITPIREVKVATRAVESIGPFKTDYIQVMAKNKMGITTYMPAQIIKKVMEDNEEKYVIRMLDKVSNSYKQKTVTAGELKLRMRAKEMPEVEKMFKDFNRQSGYQDDLEL
jgi:hypothetical protein